MSECSRFNFSARSFYRCFVLSQVAHFARARGKILAQIKAAKLLLAGARKAPSIVCCNCDEVHDIKINLYLHYQVVIINAELRIAINAIHQGVELSASKIIILVDISCAIS
jgi:hypothetical protein